MAEEAASLRARLSDKRALHVHTELVAVARAGRASAAALAAKLEETRGARARYQEELAALTGELEALRVRVAAAVAAKAHADGALLNLDTELVQNAAQLERTRAIAARRNL